MTLQLHSEMQEVLLKEKEISMCQGKKVQKVANSVKKSKMHNGVNNMLSSIF